MQPSYCWQSCSLSSWTCLGRLFTKEERVLNHTPCWGKGWSSDPAHPFDCLRCFWMLTHYPGHSVSSKTTLKTELRSKARIWCDSLTKEPCNWVIKSYWENEILKQRKGQQLPNGRPSVKNTGVFHTWTSIWDPSAAKCLFFTFSEMAERGCKNMRIHEKINPSQPF